MKAALVYAKRCPTWRLLPIAPGSKRPLIADWPSQATNDPEILTAWAEQYPDANLGVAAGHGFFVLDVDPKNGGDQTIAAITDVHGDLPETVQQATPSGGSHYLFRSPGFDVSNSAGKLGRGLDVRGLGGQIVIAPSRTEAGQYRWVRAPWDVEIAEAPEWLVSELQRAPAPAATTDRGYFPPASPEVLAEARAALDAHGPAIEGEGGDLHTFRAAAILVHDFALTEDEAWPLLEEWNAECDPPWDETDLRAKLSGGAKYGKAEYGCRRALDAVEQARKLVQDWQAAGSPESGLFTLLEQVRVIAARSGDTSRRAIIERDLVAATGLKPRDLALPKPRVAANPEPGQIEVTPRLHEVADQSIRAIAPHVFARNGVLCEVVRAERTFIADLTPPRVQDLMSRSAKYVRADEQRGLVAQVAPAPVAAILHARRTHPGVRVLEAVTTAPVFLPDGSILQDRGYNEQARVFLEPSVHVDVPEAPTLADAQAAVAVFRDLLQNFQFAEEADFSTWLAGLLSPLVKAATGNAPAPLICVSASSPGAGKTLLTDVIARIVTGSGAEVRPYNPRSPDEWGKRLTAFLKAAAPVSVFDNVNGHLGDEGLDRLITSSTWSDRLLGASDAPPLPNVTVWFATGNNIEPVGDTVRRVLMCRLNVTDERPQERTGFKYPLLADYAEAHRADLLSAALTILRAYHLAGRPRQHLAAWGSFGAWSELVRGALVWTGLQDPFLTQRRASEALNEPENEAHDFWLAMVGESDGTAGSIAVLANQRGASEVLGARDPITPYSLRRFIGRFVDKPRAGQRIRKERDAYRNQTLYAVERIS